MKENDKPISKKLANETPADKNSNKKTATKESNIHSERKNANWALRILLVVLLFLGGAMTGIYFIPALKERIPAIAQWTGSDEDTASTIGAINTTLAAQQDQIDLLAKKTNEQENLLSQLSASSSSGNTALLVARIDALEKSLSVGPGPSTVATDSSQSTRIDMLLSRMSQLEASFIPLSKNMVDSNKAEQERKALIEDNLNFAEKLANLESRLAGMETHAAKDNTGILLNLKIAELKRKVMSGEAYSSELDLVEKLIETGSFQANVRFKSALDYLSQKAESGILTPSQIERRFNDLIPDILRADDLAATSSWWATAINNVKSTISIRKTDGSSYSAEGLDGLVANIEGWLKNSDLKSVLETLTALPSAVQALLETWKIELETWLYSEDALNELESIAAEEYLTASASEQIL